MRILTAVTIGAVMAAACSAEATDPLPPYKTIEAATLAYANCVYDSASKLAARSATAEVLARQAVHSCRDARVEALTLKSVPVFFPTIAEFDVAHLDVARSAIKSARAPR